MSYPYDKRLAKRYHVMVPERVYPDGEKEPVLDVPIIDAVAWPRDVQERKTGRLIVRRVEEATKDGKVISDMDPTTRKSWMSIQRNITSRAPGHRETVRDRVEEAYRGRTFILYYTNSPEAPVRFMVHPPILKEDVGEAFRDAGWRAITSGEALSLTHVPLFTRTSKMGCISFNLPAGPPSIHGTCPSSDIGFAQHTGEELLERHKRRTHDDLLDPAAFICNGCYALKNRYASPSNIFGMHARLLLVRKLLGMTSDIKLMEVDQDEMMEARKAVRGGAGTVDVAAYIARSRSPRHRGFVETMASAIQHARRVLIDDLDSATESKFTDVEYMTEEMFEIASDVYSAARKRAAKRGDAETVKRLRAEGNKILSYRPFRPWHVPNPDYFRIHDAGDFFSPKYLKAWIEVCQVLPEVHFWAPTRVWAVQNLFNDDLLRRIPPNMVIRPSSLHFRQPPPRISRSVSYRPGVGGGLAMGSGSSASEIPEGAWDCPAYKHWSVGGGAIVRSRSGDDEGYGGTCALSRGPNGSKGCRACWDNPELEVFYHEH